MKLSRAGGRGGRGERTAPHFECQEALTKTGVRSVQARCAQKNPLVAYNSRLDIGALMTESSMVGLVSGFSSVCVISRGCEVCTYCVDTFPGVLA